jgi:hypothetical protein
LLFVETFLQVIGIENEFTRMEPIMLFLYRTNIQMPRFGLNSTSQVSNCLEYDGFFDAATVLTDHKTKS